MYKLSKKRVVGERYLLQAGTRMIASLKGKMEAEPPAFPPTVPARIMITAAKMTATTKKAFG